ncbi:MAG: hypothetical protein GKR91_17720 [Pseudomonadales bacterium]|nr:hypothetical protein [Pseudomonadales bacterium]
MNSIRRFALLLTPCLAVSAQANDEVTIDDFAFLTGAWSGTGFGGISEEMWIPPSDGRMFGIFKQSTTEELTFTEFMEIVETDEGWILRLKHFNPDFSGWEEKNDYVTFKFQSVTENKAVFGGLSYEIVDSGHLEIQLRLRQDDGSISTAIFDLAPIILN